MRSGNTYASETELLFEWDEVSLWRCVGRNMTVETIWLALLQSADPPKTGVLSPADGGSSERK